MFIVQERDVRDGADMIMVKPGMAYLDLVRDLKEKVKIKTSVIPLPCYFSLYVVSQRGLLYLAFLQMC